MQSKRTNRNAAQMRSRAFLVLCGLRVSYAITMQLWLDGVCNHLPVSPNLECRAGGYRANSPVDRRANGRQLISLSIAMLISGPCNISSLAEILLACIVVCTACSIQPTS